MSENSEISILMDFENPSIDECIKYCKERNIICEKIIKKSDALGNYIFEPNELTYYHNYFIQFCFINLHLNKKFNRVNIPSIVVFDKETSEFYIGKNKIKFYRKSSGFIGPTYVDLYVKLNKTLEELSKVPDNIIMACTLNQSQELKLIVPELNILDIYYNYFRELKYI